MRRERSRPRPDWESKVAEQGLVFGTPAGPGRPYWDEAVHYVFDMAEVLSLEADVELLHSMCLEAVEHVVLTERFADFALPEWSWEAVTASWRRGDPHLCGRFDLRYDGSGPAKLLEYNADTPTSLLEASICQWYRLKDTHPDDDQWNSLHEKLVERWGEVADRLPQRVEEAPVGVVTKLYPWEWVLGDDFGRHVTRSLPGTAWIEPLWKTLLSNKALLAVLWEMYPGHPNLLPASLGDPGMLTEYVRKPLLGREGANIAVVAPGSPHGETETGGVYGAEGFVYQLFDPLPEVDGHRPALGAWVVGDAAAGLGIRENTGLITDNGAAFVPHRVPA